MKIIILEKRSAECGLYSFAQYNCNIYLNYRSASWFAMQIFFRKFSEEDILIRAGIPVHEEVSDCFNSTVNRTIHSYPNWASLSAVTQKTFVLIH